MRKKLCCVFVEPTTPSVTLEVRLVCNGDVRWAGVVVVVVVVVRLVVAEKTNMQTMTRNYE